MTQRASDLLGEVADRLSEDATESGIVAAEAIHAIEPELLAGYKDGSIDELARMSKTPSRRFSAPSAWTPRSPGPSTTPRLATSPAATPSGACPWSR